MGLFLLHCAWLNGTPPREPVWRRMLPSFPLLARAEVRSVVIADRVEHLRRMVSLVEAPV